MLDITAYLVVNKLKEYKIILTPDRSGYFLLTFMLKYSILLLLHIIEVSQMTGVDFVNVLLEIRISTLIIFRKEFFYE